jgi:nucleoside 2-deoxyribosyltransferase
MPRIYLAGPDVFRPDAAEHFERVVRACERFGLEGLRPFDGMVDADLAEEDVPRVIYEENMSLLRSADGVIANLAPFRGTEPDSGTVFEVGVAIALGLPVVAYGVPKVGYAESVPSRRDAAGALRDMDGLAVEDFGLPMNLMLSCSVQVADSAEDALKVMAGLLGGSESP